MEQQFSHRYKSTGQLVGDDSNVYYVNNYLLINIPNVYLKKKLIYLYSLFRETRYWILIGRPYTLSAKFDFGRGLQS